MWVTESYVTQRKLLSLVLCVPWWTKNSEPLLSCPHATSVELPEGVSGAWLSRLRSDRTCPVDRCASKGVGLFCLLCWTSLVWSCVYRSGIVPCFNSAMYAGVFTCNEGHFFYCEGPPCTSLAFLSVCIGFLIKFSSLSRLIGCRYFWTRYRHYLWENSHVGVSIYKYQKTFMWMPS